jgi:hypothetical protein
MPNNPMRAPVGSLGTVITEAQPVWNNLTGAAGPVLTASGNSGSPLILTWPYRHLQLIVFTNGAVTGSLTVSLAGFAMDLPEQQQNGAGVLLGTTTAITAQYASQEISVGPGAPNNRVVPGLVQVQWAVTGSGASFADVEMSLWGR